MKFKLRHILFLLPLVLVINCKKSTKYKTTYFAGQIINPKEQKIHIYKGDSELNLSNLNANNKFHIKLDSLEEGLYTFKHGSEFQYLYLESNDSVVMRLNTWDFDESLVFSGHGSEKNNYLIQLFLDNEKAEKLFRRFYKLEEIEFIKKTDSLTNLKLKKYDLLKKQTKVSTAFNALVQTAIYYPIYSNKEKYAEKKRFFDKLKNQKTVQLSKSFYDYRKKIDINNPQFLNYYAFRNYIGNYLLNVANEIKIKENSKPLSAIILNQINQKIKNEKLKNVMLHNAVINCLLDDKCYEKDKTDAKRIFYKNCTDNNKIKDINTLTNSLDLLKKGTKFPKLKLLDSNNKEFLKLITNQNTVIYFWPKETNRIKSMAKRVRYLSKKYTNFTFIGLDNQLKNKNWKTYIKTTNLNPKNQFQLADTTINKWFINKIPRAVILNKKGIIQNDFTFISHRNFEKILFKIEKN